MAPDAIGAGTIRRLAALSTSGHPVLSVYLDLESESASTAAARDAHLRSLAHEPGLGGARPDLARIRALLRGEPELTRDARGLAVFSSTKAGVLEAVRLPHAVKPMAVVDTLPWLEPLAEFTRCENWGVAVVSARTARLFRGGVRGLTEFAVFDSSGEVIAHTRAVAERLARAHRRRAFADLAIVAPAELRALLEASLDEQLTAALVASVDAELEDVPVLQLARVLAPVIEGVERTHERALLARLEAAGHDGRLAGIGIDQVLAMLEHGQVEVLVIARDVSFTAGLCPSCGRVWANAPSCRVDGADLAPIDAVAHAVDLAADQSATVVVVDHERALLDRYGSIAALSTPALPACASESTLRPTRLVAVR